MYKYKLEEQASRQEKKLEFYSMAEKQHIWPA